MIVWNRHKDGLLRHDSLKSEPMGKLINRIPCSHPLISSLPGSALRMKDESLRKPCDSTSILKALSGKLEIKRLSSCIVYLLDFRSLGLWVVSKNKCIYQKYLLVNNNCTVQHNNSHKVSQLTRLLRVDTSILAINLFPSAYATWCLPGNLLMYFGSLIENKMDPLARQTTFLGTVWSGFSVWFADKITFSLKAFE